MTILSAFSRSLHRWPQSGASLTLTAYNSPLDHADPALCPGGLRKKSGRGICRTPPPPVAPRTAPSGRSSDRAPASPLQGSESSAIETLEEVCSQVAPFTVTLGDVETFVPRTPTVFIRVAEGSYRMRELHDQLNTKALASQEEWPYMPHLTIVKMSARVAGATSLSRGPRALGALQRHPRDPGERTDFRARRAKQIAGWISPEFLSAANWFRKGPDVGRQTSDLRNTCHGCPRIPRIRPLPCLAYPCESVKSVAANSHIRRPRAEVRRPTADFYLRSTWPSRLLPSSLPGRT